MKLSDDKGYVLATALGAIVLVTAIAIASYAVASRALNHSVSNANASKAYQIASSALEYEVSRYEHGASVVSENNKTLPSGGTYDLITTTSGTNITLKTRARIGEETEAVAVTYTVFDLSEFIYSGAGGNMFTASSFNSPQSMVIGPLYLKLQQGSTVNSSPRFVDGPLYIENGRLQPKGGVKFINTTDYDAYHVFADIRPNITASNVVIDELDQHLTPPTITSDYANRVKNQAASEGHYYQGDTNIGAATSPVPATSGVLSGSGTIYVEGTVTIDSSITCYNGNWTIFATDGIIMRGRLVPEDYATNPADPPSGSYDTYYSSLMSAEGVQLPQARENYCVTLMTPGSINSTWKVKNNSSTPFAFCGAMYAEGTIAFQESLRGSIIAGDSLTPDKKTIIATQRDLRNALSPLAQELFSRSMTKGSWVRSKN